MARHADIRRSGGTDYAGKEIFEVKPIILGGSPTDPANKVVLSREEHIKVVRYWNSVIRRLRAEARAEGASRTD